MTIHGIVAYPVTPFTAGGRIDHTALHAIIDRLLDGGASAVAPLGSTGEAAYLDLTEWTETAASTIRHVAGRAPTVVGVSDLTTDGAVRRARIAESLGADAIMALPVSYWRLTELEVQRHFESIAGAVRIPVMVYNNPATAGIDLAPEQLWELVRDVENITMVKESTGDVERMHRLRELSGGSLPFFNGSNPLALEAFRAGAAGWCTAAPCLIPEQIAAFHAAVVDGDISTAEGVFARIEPLLQFIVARGLPTTVKAGLARTGIPAGTPRRPLLELDGDEAATLVRLIESARG
ncbi:dihydrodipicolinate synthase family protein [Tsukamurella ocularis]|uniref:dihydrodipicolinate synthase family protein n=1 Tax=Tsukamurella ocularis TaxID=1970234 RepID=UPI00216A609F|nr:dihydrodipicolinate synthase family protein [Tsukamurella ocularis]MCS3779013.1 4-hydroxy-tetrahydrodipicolinate synthase [Tsukamurella ocularis]MCS3787367.1 4-hydroxy-tetrahydrodipicolinate synthase [Tsukamurella ocularis]MCS3851696.1 4-hydroxy-tetrahydrodipicolinate synthase [Tsukamurella ocularis]